MGNVRSDWGVLETSQAVFDTQAICFLQFALLSTVTASPIMNIIDRVSVEFGEESNDVLRTMKDIDITDRNMDDWWTKYNIQIAAFKKIIEGKDITVENKNANPLVCKKHEDLLKTLGDLKIQWGKVRMIPIGNM